MNVPNMYAIIPAAVRYDKNLVANAKLLYAEISALTNVHGFCFAQNQYFSKLFNVHKRTVSRLISSLQKREYITINEIRNKDGLFEERHIFLNASGSVTPRHKPIDKKVHRGRQNCHAPIDNNVVVNKNNITRDNITREESSEFGWLGGNQ